MTLFGVRVRFVVGVLITFGAVIFVVEAVVFGVELPVDALDTVVELPPGNVATSFQNMSPVLNTEFAWLGLKTRLIFLKLHICISVYPNG